MTYTAATDKTSSIKNIEDIRYRIQPFLVSRQYYDANLSSLMSSDFLDLKVCYHIPDHKNRSLFIANDTLETYGIPADLVRTQALENIKLSRYYSIQNMDEMFASMGVPVPDDHPASPIYVLTNTTGYLGTAGLLSDDLLADFSRHIKGGFHVIPSSIHEALLIPDAGEIDPKTLNEIICQVNSSNVIRPYEVLSDHVYRYDMQDRQLHM